MTDIDQYLEELAGCLRVGGAERTRILAEVRDHLEDAAAHLDRDGERPEHAVARAVDAFGSPVAIATQFNAAAGARAMRRAPIVVFTAGVAVFGGLLYAGMSQPRPRVPTHATLEAQVAFFVAALAFQIAVVAGICAASRALALSRTPAVRGNERAFVRRAALISAAALGVAVAGWVTTLGFVLNTEMHPNTASALFAGAVMFSAASLAIITTYRSRVNGSDDVTGAPVDADNLISLGERALALVRRHPVMSCATVAAVSAWPAMVHAETTFTGALPWGVIEAATVVVAFIVLGPTLDLRRPHHT